MLGPLPISALHFVAPLALFVLGFCVASAALLGVMTSGSLVGIAIGGLFGLVLLGTAAHWAYLAVSRGAKYELVVLPGAVEHPKAGSLARSDREQVHVVRIRGGRAQYPVWAIDYDDGTTSTRLGSWLSFGGERELQPLADALQKALASVPRGM